ncbi:MAG: undecaprenyldiphospho-muramoylpentapeptide beta-N-acetylglucosaminyltransferase [Bacteroidota bacterium]
MTKIIISGGGTGGHVYPAIAIANALKKADKDIDILFVGAKGKLEMEKVPKAGYPIKGLWISGFHRKLTLRNLMFPLKLLVSLFRSIGIVRRFKPDVVVGVGGYASGPLLEIATRKGIPCLVQEQNSYPGITNRLLAKKVDKICVAYEGLERWFPKNKITLTGNPVRADLIKARDKRLEGIKHFGFDPGRKTIFLTGGSLGARSLNNSMSGSLDLLKRDDVQVLWQSGKLYIDEFEPKVADLPNVKITAFVDRMDLAYAMADVVIARSGASTISELCMVGKPSILVPSPNVAEDHQTANAKSLVEKGAAILVADKDAPKEMVSRALKLMNQKEELENLSKNIRELAKPNASDEIAREVLALVKTK